MIINNKFYETIEILKDKPKATIVFIHGFTGNFYHHFFIANYLPKDVSFCALNLPACGKTPAHLHPYNSRQNYATLIKEYIEKLNLNNVIIVAHSMGASITAFLSKLLPNKIIGYFLESPENESLLLREDVVIDSKHDSIKTKIKKIQKFANNPYKMIDTYKDKKIILQAKYLATHPFALKVFYDLAIKKNLLSSITKTNSIFKEINKPTVIMFGRLDYVLPYENSYLNFKKIKNKNFQLISVNNAGHSIYKDAKKMYICTLLKYLIDNNFSDDKVTIRSYLEHFDQY